MNDNQKTFLLHVATRPGERSHVKIELENAEPRTDIKPETEQTQANGLSLKSDRDAEASKELRRLSDDWTSIAIGFFESVPLMSWLNFMIAEGDLSENVIAYASSKAISQEETAKDDGSTLKEFRLFYEEMPVIARKLGKSTHSLKAAGSMGRSALAALISEYESFLAKLLKIIGTLQPNIFVNDDDQISIREVQSFQSISQIKEAMLESKIEELLHEKSHVEVLQIISKKLGVNLESDKAMISEFVEVCQRRNLLVHGSGIVNKRYLRACDLAGYKHKDSKNLGDKLEIDRSYLRSATARVYLVGFFTLHIIWQKLIPRSTSDSIQAILEASHDLVDANLTKTCRKVCDFVLNSKSKISEKHRAFIALNRAQSFLFEPRISDAECSEGVSASLKMQDWSMTSPVVKLALACVNRSFNDIENLAKSAISDGLDYHAAQTWSIFREVRELPEFSRCFVPDRPMKVLSAPQLQESAPQTLGDDVTPLPPTPSNPLTPPFAPSTTAPDPPSDTR